MLDFLHNFNLSQWIATIGYFGVFCIIFFESGVFFACFFPGDSLMFAAGILAAKGLFKISLLAPVMVLASILGYLFAYWFGNKLGHWLSRRPDSFYFKKKYIAKSHEFYEKHGGKALLIGRLLPIVRTFVPIVAGMAEMNYQAFVIYNIIGGLLWAGSITIIGFYFGNLIPDSIRMLVPMMMFIVAMSIIPMLLHYIRRRKLKNR
jgi:membrane-associated protein